MLEPDMQKIASMSETIDFNAGIDKIMREIMHLKIMLSQKLENFMEQTPNPCPHPPHPPCPHPPEPPPPWPPHCHPPDHKYMLAGWARGQIKNKSDVFYCGIATAEAISYRSFDCYYDFSLRYSVCKNEEKSVISLNFSSVPDSISSICQGSQQSVSHRQNSDEFSIRGKGTVSLKESGEKPVTSTASFMFTAWDFSCHTKFQMIIYSPIKKLCHDSGTISASSGDMKIIKCSK